MTNQVQTQKPTVTVFPGIVAIGITLLSLLLTIALPFLHKEPNNYGGWSYISGDLLDWLTIPMAIFTVFMLSGFNVIEPKEARVLVLFGRFKGVLMENGIFWIQPFVGTVRFILKIESFESAIIKVNDKTGSPINGAAVVSAKIVDPEAYAFNAEDPQALIMNAIDRVLRKTVSMYAYDITTQKEGDEDKDSDEACLRSDSDEVSEKFKAELQLILSNIGMHVLDANFTNLSYAPEIASVMLQRQQASALMDSRKMLVKSTVTVVKDAIKAMESTENNQAGIKMTDETKAQLAANLLTVMVSDRGAQVTLPLG